MTKRIDPKILAEAIRLVHEERYPIRIAALRMGMHRITLSKYYAKSGYPTPRLGKIPDEVYLYAQDLIDKGMQAREAASAAGIDVSSLTRWRQQTGQPHLPVGSRAEGRGSVLTRAIKDALSDRRPHRSHDIYMKVADVIPPGQAIRAAESDRIRQLPAKVARDRERDVPIEHIIEIGKRQLFRTYAKNSVLIKRWYDDEGELWLQLKERAKIKSPPSGAEKV